MRRQARRGPVADAGAPFTGAAADPFSWLTRLCGRQRRSTCAVGRARAGAERTCTEAVGAERARTKRAGTIRCEELLLGLVARLLQDGHDLAADRVHRSPALVGD